MTIELVYIESQHGVPSNEAFYKAWEGFRKRGFPCDFFESADISKLPLNKNTLVVGGLRTVESSFERIGIALPKVDYLPSILRKYHGRKSWSSNWGELRAKYGAHGPDTPLFVKPLNHHKGFSSMALYNVDDIQAAANFPDYLEVFVQEYVLFESEWRCFVLRGQVIEMSHYQGEVFTYPDVDTILEAIEDYSRQAPVAYVIDFGVIDTGRTILVECGDGYSMGSYGLNASEYSEMLEARWCELAGLTQG